MSDILSALSEHLQAPEKSPWVWVFYGDSITHGAKHTHGARSFVEVFQERLRWELRCRLDSVINSGFSGYHTLRLLEDDVYNNTLKRFKPDVVFLLIGTNDISYAECGDVNDFKRHLYELIKRLQNDCRYVILQTYPTIMPHPDPEHGYNKRFREMPAYNDAIREAAAKHDLLLIDHDRYWQKCHGPAGPEAWLGEMIHPGAVGHLEMAKLIFKALDMDDPASDCCNVLLQNKFVVY